MKTQLTPLELLDKFFTDNSQQKVEEYLERFENMNFEGPTVQEYFTQFDLEFERYAKDNFAAEYSSEILLNCIDNNFILLATETLKHFSNIPSSHEEDIIDSASEIFAIAA